MSSYLEAYGAAEEQRSRRVQLVKYIAISLAAVLIVGLTLYFVFRNHSEEQQAKSFVALLNAHDYQGAYRLWGCNETHPCAEYPFQKFQDDWGPSSSHADQSSAKIGLSQACGSGVVIRLDYRGSEDPVALWVERSTNVVSFAPWAECPGTRHLRFGAFLKSLFSH
jgi:hypothetical protein